MLVEKRNQKSQLDLWNEPWLSYPLLHIHRGGENKREQKTRMTESTILPNYIEENKM